MDGSSFPPRSKGCGLSDGERPQLDAFRPAAHSWWGDWRDRYAHPVSLAIAAGLHLVLAAIFLPAHIEALGDGGRALEAIAVDLVDAIPANAAPQIAATQSLEAKAADDGAVSTHTLEVPSPVKAAAVEDALKPDISLEDEMRRPPPSSARAASVGSLATAEASPGVVSAYGARVARIISQGRPLGSFDRAFKGKVVLAFAIDPAGRLERVEVYKSSGNPDLDNRAMAALQKLSFPAPSATMTARQRSFAVPFEFR